MTAATADRSAFERAGGGRFCHFPVAAETEIFTGTLVCLDDSGYAVPAADTASYVFVGVAAEGADNSSGSDGDINIKVWRKGVFRFAYNPGSAARTNIGDTVYVYDDSTVTVAGSVTNDHKCGKIHDYVDASNVDVDIEHIW